MTHPALGGMYHGFIKKKKKQEKKNSTCDQTSKLLDKKTTLYRYLLIWVKLCCSAMSSSGQLALALHVAKASANKCSQ